MRALATVIVWGMAAGSLLSACGSRDVAVFVRVGVTKELEATQLRFTLAAPGGKTLGPVTRPERAQGTLSGEQSARLVFPDALANSTVELTVEALRGSDVVAIERAQLKLTAKADNELGIQIGPDDAPATSGCEQGCAAGQACVDGRCTCTAASCAGCCDGDACVTGDSPTACGIGGQACQACPSGQGCSEGVCSDCAATCTTGCCKGAACTPVSLSACGAAGAACSTCDEVKADSCSAKGACACGGGPPCADGQRCAGGACVCDAVSCPSGCCDGTSCVVRSITTCGSQGSTCVSCDGAASDNCSSDGACRCGSGGPCGAGQKCVAGACVCDASTCSGCCDGNVCQPGTDKAACGTGGGSCQNCKGNRSCVSGQCT